MIKKYVFHFNTDGLIKRRLYLQDDGQVNLNDPSPLTIRDKDLLILAVPSESVLLTSVTLPKTSRKKIAQAIPFLIEDQLTLDVKEYHFSIAEDQPKENSIDLGITSHEQMKLWVAENKILTHRRPSVIIPDNLLLPYADHEWSVLIEDNRAAVRTGKNSGFGCSINNLELMMQSRAKETQYPKKIIVFNCSTIADITPYLWHDKDVHTRIITDQTPELIFLRAIEQPLPLNLLQHDYTGHQRVVKTKKTWGLAWILLWVLLGLWLVGAIPQLIYLNYKNHRIQTHMETIYNQYIPGVMPDNPLPPLQDQLHKRIGEVHGNSFLTLMAGLAQSCQHYRDVTINHLQFDGARLTLQVSTPNEAILDNFIQSLSRDGLSAQKIGTPKILSSSQVDSTLNITRT